MNIKMYARQSTGKIGEALAARYLEGIGYTILHRNWRSGRNEIDLISSKAGILHFFEVKTRRTVRYGWPEDHIKTRKIRRMMQAAEAYLEAANKAQPVQLNIVSIVVVGSQPPIFYLIEDISTF
jgi:putative endonuclease